MRKRRPGRGLDLRDAVDDEAMARAPCRAPANRRPPAPASATTKAEQFDRAGAAASPASAGRGAARTVSPDALARPLQKACPSETTTATARRPSAGSAAFRRRDGSGRSWNNSARRARRRIASFRRPESTSVVSVPPSRNGTIPKLPPKALRRTRASSANSARPRPPIGIAEGVARAELLIAVSANRSAAAGIEAPRRSDLRRLGADDRADADAAGGDHAVRHRMIGARIDLHAAIGEAAALRGDFRADAAAETEARGRVEQIVAAVVAKAERKRRRSGRFGFPSSSRSSKMPRSSVAIRSAP